MNVFKKQILKDSKDVIKSLSNKDVEEINEIKRETEKIKEVEEAKKQFIETNTNIKIHQIEQDRRKTQADTDFLNYQISNIKTQCIEAKQKRMLSYFNIKNDGLVRELEDLKNEGETLDLISLICAIISSFTTCIGLSAWFLPFSNRFDVVFYIFSLLATITASVIMNKCLKALIKYVNQIWDLSTMDKLKKIRQSTTASIYLYVIVSYTIYSIITNYELWSRCMSNIIGILIFSCLFDFISIATASSSSEFKFVSVSQAYENEIVSLEEDKPREEEQNSQNIHISSVQNVQTEEEKNGQNEELKTGKTVGQEVQEEQVKIVQEISDVKTGQTIEFKPKAELSKTDKKQVKTEDKKQSKKPSVKRTSASKVTFKNMQESINNLPEGTIIKPKLLNMTGNSNYKTWIKKCENVERAENGNYIKKTNSNLIALER